MGKRKSSKESRAMRYYVRAVKRFTTLAFWVFIAFCIVMGIVWAVPKVWNWALA